MLAQKIQESIFFQGLYLLIKAAVFSILIFFAAMLVLMPIFSGFTNQDGLLFFISQIMINGLACLFLIKFLKINTLPKYPIVFKTSQIPFYVLLFVLFEILNDTICEFLPLPSFTNNEFIKQVDSRDISFLLTAVFIGPIIEEMIFRGLYMRYFLAKTSTNTAILYSSMLFAIVHVSPDQVIQTFLAGLLLGYLYVKTHSIFVPILVHIAHNALTYLYMSYGHSSFFDFLF
ncbi:CPBP family intramembrane glutamic endopeptidase [Haliscomenobacter hydrossis]|uniref:Abortive infection protein n=1 Tax=Haliscomenobacter hydrossis (strain ATCC 27775 / DSM 1100 / LMG 10767 / O) TaxID=760192 RepID=F4KYL6_HALH1|nr:type II CAAX endopeptidase family protein [Haliscomenobacter hydrossis]AEE50422.1 Abortive infection protein [Haliscomenobacter hydrossis DSM 1100]